MGDLRLPIQAQPTASNGSETINRIARAILDCLNVHSVSTAETIGGLVKGRRAYKVKALRNLQVSGEVLRIGSGKKCDPFRYGLASRTKPRMEPKPPARDFVEEVMI